MGKDRTIKRQRREARLILREEALKSLIGRNKELSASFFALKNRAKVIVLIFTIITLAFGIFAIFMIKKGG